MSVQVIDSFRVEYMFLSNFDTEYSTLYRSIFFKSSEHAYQWAKCANDAGRRRVRDAKTPADAKRIGHHVLMRANWDTERVKYMRNIIHAKFSHGSDYARMLLDTGDALLIEGNKHGDTFWGQCNGVGENWLGILLMERRAELRALEKL